MRFKVANYSRLEIRLDTLHIYMGHNFTLQSAALNYYLADMFLV